jgi:beta-glucanase (GH16 family)
MRRWYVLAAGTTLLAAVVLPSIGLAGGPLSSVPLASASTLARPADRAASAVRPPRGKPAFDPSFSGKHLNTKTWDTCYQWADQSRGCTNFGNPEETEWYLPSQVRLSGGIVHLVARREKTVGTSKTGARKVYSCRSGMITSYPGFKFEYGFVQVVANIPHAKGLWPALWLHTADGKSRPEIDMLESWGVDGNTGSFYHPVTGHHSRAYYSPKLTVGWHTYSLSWTKSKLAFYVDKKLVLTVSKNVPHQRMYFIADLAEYQPAKAGYCTGQLQIKSVKIWKA